MRTFSTLAALGAAFSVSNGQVVNPFLAQGKITGNSFGLPGTNATYDYVVVGAGLAGGVVATRLAESMPNATVAVIEAGSFYEISNSNYSQIPHYSQKFAGSDPTEWQPLIDWGIVTEPITPGGAGRRVLYAQGKTIGGSSARNQQIYHRGTKGWYQSIVNATGDDAYTWDNMLPFMKKTFSFTPPDVRFRAANASANFSLSAFNVPGGEVQLSYPKYGQPVSSYGPAAYAAAGFDAIPDFLEGNLNGYGYHLFTLNPDDSTRSSTEVALLSPALKKTSLKMYQSCMARNLLFDENKRVTGVNVTAMGLKPFTLSARKEVIVSSGTFHSPQLLMVSGIGPREQLEKHNISVISELSGVGQNLADTPNVGGVTHSMNVDAASAFEQNEATFNAAVEQFFTNGSGPLSSPSGDFVGWEVFPQSIKSNMSASTRDWLATLPSDWPNVEYTLGASSRSLNPMDNAKNLGSVGMLLTSTSSRGNVSIASSDNSVAPIIHIGWLSTPQDQEIAVAAYKRARKIASGFPIFMQETAPGANVTTDAQILEYIKKTGLTSIHHAAGTCAMGKNASSGAVTDSQARVFGVQGLRVVDTSNLPFSAPGHTQGVTYAHAEKIAQDIINAAKQS